MNNYELDARAKELTDSRSAYSLARELIELKSSPMSNWDAFENWFVAEYPNTVEKGHLKVCRCIDQKGARGYSGLGQWYSESADITLTASIIAWDGRGRSL